MDKQIRPWHPPRFWTPGVITSYSIHYTKLYDFEERTELLAKDRARFKRLVNDSLKQHYELIQKLTAKGTYFFDYGNAFLKAVFDAGVTQVSKNGVDAKDGFVYPSYFEDIMGPIFRNNFV